MVLLPNDPDRILSRRELDMFNMLTRPVWVFDIKAKKMYWANTRALALWDAESLESLIERDFASDMTDATEKRLEDYFDRITKGEVVKEQWTLYPSGKSTTLRLSGSAIRIEDGRTGALYEAEEIEKKEEINETSVRAVEMLRHLPLAVCQFGFSGGLVYQNPEAASLFGRPCCEDGCCSNCFLARFVDRQLGKSVLEQVQQGKDCNVETEHYTLRGPRWFNISVRKATDPVTSDHIILYNARDITQIIQARRDTNRANLKSEFVAVMAHEIRTPLHQIVGSMDLLELTQLNDEQKKHVRMAQSSATSLMTIINDLLDYSKLENGKLQLDRVCFDLEGVLNGCIAVIEPEASAKRLQVVKKYQYLDNTSASNSTRRLVGDPNRLRQILLNLLNNAVKFTNCGRVELRVSFCCGSEVPDTLRMKFEVIDTGIGIDASQQSFIFDKYQQAHTAIARNYGGNGLGLAICKSLAEVMGGYIGLHSVLDHGTTVSFELPFGVAVKEERPEDMNSDQSDGSLNILVAEDNKINQKVVRSMLQRIGHTVKVAENGQIAVEELKKAQDDYDLVLMDIQMPVMDGIEATRLIRSMGYSKPVVGLTASFQHSDLDYYHEVGMSDCLGKPIRLNHLKRALSHQPMDNEGSPPKHVRGAPDNPFCC